MPKVNYDTVRNPEWEKNHLALYMEQGRKKRNQFFEETAKLPFPIRQLRLLKMWLRDGVQSLRFRHRLKVDPSFRRKVMYDLMLYKEIQQESSSGNHDTQK